MMKADAVEDYNSVGEEEARKKSSEPKAINDLQRDQSLMLDSVTKFANRTERRQQDNYKEIRANQELLQQVIEQLQEYAHQNETRQSTQEAVITQLQSEVATLRQQVQLLSANTTSTGQQAASPAVTMPAASSATPVVTGMDENSATCIRQHEAPIYSGETSEDIEVYVLNMIKWYAAIGLNFHQQVDYRVGELMMNHTQGKAKDWFLREYHGEQRWSHIIRKMKQRFLDTYNDEFRRLARTAGVSEYIKILRYKQGLSSVQLLHLLKTKSFDTLDELIEASRTLNPREVARSNDKSSKSSKSFPPKQDKKMDAAKCTSSWCTEKGHTKERCWMLHPELKPKWLKDNNKNKGKGAAAVSKTNAESEEKKLWSVLSMIQSDIAKLKGDLN
ncbi:hypothetical protein PHYSODRAFT_332657 [Phytophthora sojae]|uniref:Retrotransposon gag domain-containing protein n=1 Tax=Phytophthora sojae (strain P6497) TaxID=1094619 RepID=G4ZCY1_PHYSP|nr:hypothetical protein PHYSODRAFT_332657 [Phytophthora sojae]EGZ18929.1 hypothetical protein PHYSODRAFT_332657 [Phytophthora sojae]|eukprot:XP_009527987.1 hypothetical protein PHYSODRAFT_332657 [Phytophthora sojae]